MQVYQILAILHVHISLRSSADSCRKNRLAKFSQVLDLNRFCSSIGRDERVSFFSSCSSLFVNNPFFLLFSVV